ncbi:hypothetical protein GQ53DRAFT_92121 [Thozetella sp. PMI_491]|nr:hypothetical protein GQ53DRAFT_92121 [Thozetella sp. PMI_491]
MPALALPVVMNGPPPPRHGPKQGDTCCRYPAGLGPPPGPPRATAMLILSSEARTTCHLLGLALFALALVCRMQSFCKPVVEPACEPMNSSKNRPCKRTPLLLSRRGPDAPACPRGGDERTRRPHVAPGASELARCPLWLRDPRPNHRAATHGQP